MSTIAPPKMFDFMSRNARLRLVRIAQIDQPEPLTGGFRTHRRGVVYEFTAGRLQVHEGQDMLPTGPPEPGDMEFKPTMEDAVMWLRRHRLYNQQGAASEGFYEIGREPERLQPYEEDVREQIVAAAIALSDEHLERIIEEERTGHNRASLIHEAEKALEGVRAAREELQAQAEAAAAENAQNAAQKTEPAAKAAPAKKGPAKG